MVTKLGEDKVRVWMTFYSGDESSRLLNRSLTWDLHFPGINRDGFTTECSFLWQVLCKVNNFNKGKGHGLWKKRPHRSIWTKAHQIVVTSTQSWRELRQDSCFTSTFQIQINIKRFCLSFGAMLSFPIGQFLVALNRDITISFYMLFSADSLSQIILVCLCIISQEKYVFNDAPFSPLPKVVFNKYALKDNYK